MPKATQTQISIDLLTEVIKCSNAIGPKQTALALKQAQFSTSKQKKISDIIIDTTCQHMRVTRAQALDGSSRGDRPIAMMIIFVLHKQHLNFTNLEVAKLFSKDENRIVKWDIYFRKLTDEHRADADVLKKFNTINAVVIKKIK